METDSFFYKLLKTLPQTLFELLNLPPERERDYRFDSVELKKSFRIDGLYLPNTTSLPLYFVEIQHQRVATFYANLFAKVFCYLGENDPTQEWNAVAIFPSRGIEPSVIAPYEDLINSRRVTRIYLDEYPMPKEPAPGLGILQLVSAPTALAKRLVAQLVSRTESKFVGGEMRSKVVELVEELMIRRFPQLDREEVRKMFELADLRNTRVWKEAHEEGRDLGEKALARKLLAIGVSAKDIAQAMKISVAQVKRLAKESAE